MLCSNNADNSLSNKLGSEHRQQPVLPASTKIKTDLCTNNSQILRKLHQDVISVCIPAYNEEETLAIAVRSVQESELWKLASNRELLICLNACSDSSFDIAKRLATEDSSIKIINISDKGKNNAWMELVKQSSSAASTLFFLDADSLLRNDTLYRLYETLQNKTDLLAVGSEIYPLPESSSHDSFFQKLMRLRLSERCGGNGERDELNGNCYAIKRSEAIKIKRSEDQRISEDKFINLKLRGFIERVPGTACFQGIPNFRDFIQQVSRTRVSTTLMQKYYPDLFCKSDNTKKKNSRNKYSQRSVSGTIARVIIEAARFIGRCKAFWISRSNSDSWRKVTSSKLPEKIIK